MKIKKKINLIGKTIMIKEKVKMLKIFKKISYMKFQKMKLKIIKRTLEKIKMK